MRVETYNQVAGLYPTKKSTKVQGSTGVGNRDEVQISQTGHDYQIAKQAVAQASDIREDKVAQLKAQIDAGTYQVSTDDFASKLIAAYKALQ
jgi:negative regulator of flagellin synthesis FlgM